jgi:hypothetical protein
MTMIESHHTIGIPVLTNKNDEEFGEEIVELLIVHANARRRAQDLPELCVGALASPGLPGMIGVEASCYGDSVSIQASVNG